MRIYELEGYLSAQMISRNTDHRSDTHAHTIHFGRSSLPLLPIHCCIAPLSSPFFSILFLPLLVDMGSIIQYKRLICSSQLYITSDPSFTDHLSLARR